MQHPSFSRGAATALAAALFSGMVLAQAVPPVMTDTAPLPASDRDSLGAVIQEPVLAQREAMQQARERAAADTRAMGAGTARALSREERKDKREADKRLKAAP